MKEEHSVYAIKFYAMQKQIDDLKKENKKLQEEKDHYKNLYGVVKKQKDDVVDYIKNNTYFEDNIVKTMIFGDFSKELLRMLGEIDVEDKR